MRNCDYITQERMKVSPNYKLLITFLSARMLSDYLRKSMEAHFSPMNSEGFREFVLSRFKDECVELRIVFTNRAEKRKG